MKGKNISSNQIQTQMLMGMCCWKKDFTKTQMNYHLKEHALDLDEKFDISI